MALSGVGFFPVRWPMRLHRALLAVRLCATRLALCDEGHRHSLTEEEVGSVHFSTSCQPALANNFNRAVALLHSFQYEQARQAFTDIVGKDPQCAMAQWGVAMSHYHGMWGNGDTAAGAIALGKAEQMAASHSKNTAREQAYIAALAGVYREGG